LTAHPATVTVPWMSLLTRERSCLPADPAEDGASADATYQLRIGYRNAVRIRVAFVVNQLMESSIGV